jgi:hypothetical protein
MILSQAVLIEFVWPLKNANRIHSDRRGHRHRKCLLQRCFSLFPSESEKIELLFSFRLVVGILFDRLTVEDFLNQISIETAATIDSS